jgi:prevent-host-death family protein
MVASDPDSVGLRELRHRTGDVLARVQRGETVDVTDRGRLIARIVPVAERAPTPKLQQLLDAGRAQAAVRPGTRPRMRAGDGTNRLGDALRGARADEAW